MKFNCRDHDEFPMKLKINYKAQILKDHFYFRRKIFLSQVHIGNER